MMQLIVHNPLPPPPGTPIGDFLAWGHMNAVMSMALAMETHNQIEGTCNMMPADPVLNKDPYERMTLAEEKAEQLRTQRGLELISKGLVPQTHYDLGCVNHTRDVYGIPEPGESSIEFILRTTPKTPEPVYAMLRQPEPRDLINVRPAEPVYGLSKPLDLINVRPAEPIIRQPEPRDLINVRPAEPIIRQPEPLEITRTLDVAGVGRYAFGEDRLHKCHYPGIHEGADYSQTSWMKDLSTGARVQSCRVDLDTKTNSLRTSYTSDTRRDSIIGLR